MHFPQQVLKHLPKILLKQQNTLIAITNHLNPNRSHARSEQNFETPDTHILKSQSQPQSKSQSESPSQSP